MFDRESPLVKLVLRVLGYVADGIAVISFIWQAIQKEPPPSWAILLFILGIAFIVTGRRVPGDFTILSREIFVDIKKWDGSSNPAKDIATTYRIDQVKCRKKGARFLKYQDYSTSGQRTIVDVYNYQVALKPKPLNSAAVDLEIDLGPNCRYGKQYHVYSRCEYVDTFPNVKTESYEVSISYPTEKLKITILLPNNKPCADAVVTESVGATTETQSPLPTLSENRRVITWTRKNPSFNSKYMLTWNW